MLKKLLLFLLLLVLLLVGAGVGGFVYYNRNLQPVSSQSEEVEYTVNPGSSLSATIDDLEAKGLIKNALVTKIESRRLNIPGIVAGDFIVNKNMSPIELLTYLGDSKNIVTDEIDIQFIEGRWAKHYAQAIADKTEYTSDEVLAYWNDPEVLNALIERYEVLTPDILNDEIFVKLEGYLAPNTYRFFRDESLEDITNTLIKPTNDFYLQHKELFDNNEYTIHEIYSLASMVLFEASGLEEQRLVSSVFLNRLEANMPLQSSVTVCYALYDYEHWRDCETNIQVDSPYNTYVIPGIPVGPVANVTNDTVLAVIDPIESDYFYFVNAVCTTGETFFSRTFAEHDALVKEHLGGCR